MKRLLAVSLAVLLLTAPAIEAHNQQWNKVALELAAYSLLTINGVTLKLCNPQTSPKIFWRSWGGILCASLAIIALCNQDEKIQGQQHTSNDLEFNLGVGAALLGATGFTLSLTQ